MQETPERMRKSLLLFRAFFARCWRMWFRLTLVLTVVASLAVLLLVLPRSGNVAPPGSNAVGGDPTSPPDDVVGRGATDDTTESVPEEEPREMLDEVLDVATSAPADNETALVEDIERKYPYMAYRFWIQKHQHIYFYNRTCAWRRPAMTAHYSNLYWQTMVAGNGVQFHIYGAYYDDRPLVGARPLVRLLAMVDSRNPPQVRCQFWYDDQNQPGFSLGPAILTRIWRQSWGGYSADNNLDPFLISCGVPNTVRPGSSYKVPSVVSLVENNCQNATNIVRVLNERSADRGGIAVCVKGLNFLNRGDLAVRIVEWLELLKLLKCKKVFMYEYAVHADIAKVLRHYEAEGFVDVQKITLPGPLPNLPELYDHYQKTRVNSKRSNEVLIYNDCLYRNLNKYDYVALLDLDEVILPTGDFKTWPEAVNVIRNQNRKYSALCARNVYFFNTTSDVEAEMENIPSYMNMLTTIVRATNFNKKHYFTKCFHDVRNVMTLHNHYPIHCLGGKCHFRDLELGEFRLHHYRKDCVIDLKATCKRDFTSTAVRDTTLWTYKDDLVRNTKVALRKLGFLRHRLPEKDYTPETFYS